MDKQKLREIIVDQKLQLLLNNVIERDLHKQIEKYLNSEQILVISGIRRCGKSTLLQQIKLASQESDYYLNFDDERLIQFTIDDFQSLLEIFIELYGEQHHFYFDEIQNIKGWERFIRRLHDYGHKIIITGSNASMLSSELGTHLTGRYYEVNLFPFSFAEYLRYKKFDWSDYNSTIVKAKLQKSFRNYLEIGGMPGFIKFEQKEYLKTLYENILYRDVVARYHLNKITELKELVYYAAGNVGKEISFNKLKVLLGLGSASTVKDYFSYLRDSFLFFLLPKFDYSLKKQIHSNKKIYIIDTGFAQLLGFRFSSDHGRLLENLVFIELMRRKNDIYYHQDKKECDFILYESRKVIAAIQVTVSIYDAVTKKREIDGLFEAMKRYQLKEGLLLTVDEEGQEVFVKDDIRYKILIRPVWKWLLEVV